MVGFCQNKSLGREGERKQWSFVSTVFMMFLKSFGGMAKVIYGVVPCSSYQKASMKISFAYQDTPWQHWTVDFDLYPE